MSSYNRKLAVPNYPHSTSQIAHRILVQTEYIKTQKKRKRKEIKHMLDHERLSPGAHNVTSSVKVIATEVW